MVEKVVHKLNYPVNFRELKINCPTLLYISENGYLMEVGLSDEQKQVIVELLKKDYDIKQ